jgi:3-phytase
MRPTSSSLLTAVAAIAAVVLALQAAPVLQPALATDPVAHDPDDPAIWVHPADPSKSLILGTDKIAGEGALYVFGLDGKQRQRIAPLDRPNNVDVEYGLSLGGRRVDIAVVTERKQHRLRIFGIPADGGALVDLAPAGVPVLAGETGARSEPMGIALYKRPADGAIFAIVAPKTGGTTDYLWQYRLEDDGRGGVKGTAVRRFGGFSQRGPVAGDVGEIEAVVVDDELGYVYYSDERFGIRKRQADPDHADAAKELAVFATDGYEGDREGLAIYAEPDVSNGKGASTKGTGYIVSSDQIPGGTRLHLFRREGAPGRPHDHGETVAVIPTASDATDGLEVTSRPLPGFPRGLLVMMNSTPKNFLIYGWDRVEQARADEARTGRARTGQPQAARPEAGKIRPSSSHRP